MTAVLVALVVIIAGCVGWVAGYLYGSADAERKVKESVSRHPAVDPIRGDGDPL